MKTKTFFVTVFVLVLLIRFGDAKGGRGGFSSRGGGFSSRGSSSKTGSSGGWFSSKSPSSKPIPANNPPSYGWNVKPGPPAGAPPAYPGLSNRPVGNANAPPAYSPSFSNPPAYNPAYRQNYPGSYNNYNYKPPNYGSTFGSQGLGGNTYISNNYYGGYGGRSGGFYSGSSFLTNALFFGAGMHAGYGWGHRRSWDSEDDRRWRSTTKAPYFENKVPGSESYLPAAAVIGAATAFGLASLLPLNVPANKPLMYCNGSEVAQNPILLGSAVYSCANETIMISCSQAAENSLIDDCKNQTMTCDFERNSDKLYCTNATLFSSFPIVCNSTSKNDAEVNGTTIINCYRGSLTESQASFIPTEAPIVTTTEKPLSIKAKMHIFFMKLVGKSDIIEKAQTPTTTAAPSDDIPRWIPEALTIPPENVTIIPEISNETASTTEFFTVHDRLS